VSAGRDEERLLALLAQRRVVVLTGAGCSTESGIPDYRGAGRPASTRVPIVHDAFIRSAAVRRRYWARSTLGWQQFSAAAPNAAHRALRDLERAGVVRGIITQNVDGLHGAAGSHTVVELHGALREVRCLDCHAAGPRAALQRRLLAANPGWLERGAAAMAAPDGDAELPADLVTSFVVVGCERCGGALMPRVVFFGGTVPRSTVDSGFALVDRAAALLVVGSSLAVYSGYRFVRRAADLGVPIAILNLGPTRGDDLSEIRLAARAGEILPRLAARLA
jgi:NAD-dependent SIR2 family protein deacetylase